MDHDNSIQEQGGTTQSKMNLTSSNVGSISSLASADSSSRPSAFIEHIESFGATDALDRENHSVSSSGVAIERQTEEVLAEKGNWTCAVVESVQEKETVVEKGLYDIAKPPEGIITSKDELKRLAGAHQLPSEEGTPTTRYLWKVFSMYRVIFSMVLFANGIVALFTSLFASITTEDAATAAAANLCVAILFRNEHVVNILFRAVTRIGPSAPFWMRRVMAKVYAYGGFHSGCAISGTIWYIAATILFGLNYDGPSRWLLLGFSVSISVLLWSIACAAFPTFRVAHHNKFENVHRLAGWTAIIILWMQVLFSTSASAHATYKHFAIVLLQTPTFWFLDVISITILYPWSRLRLRPVRIERLSSRAALLHFDYRRMDTCQGVRLTTSPLKETHSFATISNPSDELGFRVLMSRAGDWTSGIIDNPTTRDHIWVKGAPTYGVLRVGLIFRKVLVIATGTGIGPCLSLLESRPDHPVHVLWMGSDPIASYGNSIIKAVYNADPEAYIVDTTKAGRGNILALAYSRFVESNAEAVVIISNPLVTALVVEGLSSRGVPAYGPIFDS